MLLIPSLHTSLCTLHDRFTHRRNRSWIPATVHDLDLPGRAERYVPDLYDLYDLYDLAHVAGCESHNLLDLGHMFPGLDLYCTDPAQHIITAG